MSILRSTKRDSALQLAKLFLKALVITYIAFVVADLVSSTLLALLSDRSGLPVWSLLGRGLWSVLATGGMIVAITVSLTFLPALLFWRKLGSDPVPLSLVWGLAVGAYLALVGFFGDTRGLSYVCRPEAGILIGAGCLGLTLLALPLALAVLLAMVGIGRRGSTRTG